jgi:hypothetical protein
MTSPVKEYKNSIVANVKIYEKLRNYEKQSNDRNG